MAQEFASPKETVRANGIRLRRHRLACQLTQTQLAILAGYSDRVIRKAEGSGRLNRATLEDIVEVFNCRGVPVTANDLICEPEGMARQFIECYGTYGPSMLQHCGDLLAEDFRFECAGDPTTLSFAGAFRGAHGFQTWLDRYFACWRRPRDWRLEPQFLTNDTAVLARYQELMEIPDGCSPPVWTNLHFEVSEGYIQTARKEFDTYLMQQLLGRTEDLRSG